MLGFIRFSGPGASESGLKDEVVSGESTVRRCGGIGVRSVKKSDSRTTMTRASAVDVIWTPVS